MEPLWQAVILVSYPIRSLACRACRGRLWPSRRQPHPRDDSVELGLPRCRGPRRAVPRSSLRGIVHPVICPRPADDLKARWVLTAASRTQPAWQVILRGWAGRWLRGSRSGLSILALLVGAGAGLGAVAFRYLIKAFTWLATGCRVRPAGPGRQRARAVAGRRSSC